MEYIYDVVVEKDGNAWTARVPQFENLTTTAESPEGAARGIATQLKGAVSERLSAGHDVPRYERVVDCITIGIDVAPDDVDTSRYVSLKDAADLLGVSRSRISQMVTSGKLSSVLFRGSRLIALESIERCKQSPRQPGRPRKRSGADADEVLE